MSVYLHYALIIDCKQYNLCLSHKNVNVFSHMLNNIRTKVIFVYLFLPYSAIKPCRIV